MQSESGAFALSRELLALVLAIRAFHGSNAQYHGPSEWRHITEGAQAYKQFGLVYGLHEWFWL